jgi:serine/threonine-protein phosphatase 6 regulatory ankyrin repeat subunit B
MIPSLVRLNLARPRLRGCATASLPSLSNLPDDILQQVIVEQLLTDDDTDTICKSVINWCQTHREACDESTWRRASEALGLTDDLFRQIIPRDWPWRKAFVTLCRELRTLSVRLCRVWLKGARSGWPQEILSGLMRSMASPRRPTLRAMLIALGAHETPDEWRQLDALFWDAAERGDVAEMMRLLESGADVNNTGGFDNETALMEASCWGDAAVVRALLAAGADVNQADNYGHTALLEASWRGHADVVAALLAAGANVNRANNHGTTALNWASAEDTTIVEMLLAAGADVNQADNDGKTALMQATERGRTAIVEMLLAAGANVNRTNSYGETALMEASLMGHAVIVEMLVEAGADVNVTNNDGKTALDLAGKKHFVVKLLTEHMLFPAVHAGDVAKTRLLLEKDFNLVNLVDENGETALAWASHRGDVDMVRLLLDYGADVNIAPKSGWTALMAASERGHVAVVKMLLRNGVFYNDVDEDGRTALSVATENGHDKVVALLRARGAR